LAAIETRDNQIDYSSIHVIKKPGPDFDYVLKQYREVVPRSGSLDPIVKLATVFLEDDFNYTVTVS